MFCLDSNMPYRVSKYSTKIPYKKLVVMLNQDIPYGAAIVQLVEH